MIITLIGYRGTGKTSVAAPLAARLNWDWVDADVEIERRAGRTIREIFDDGGEPEFRRIEREVISDLLKRDRVIIAAGGGAILNEATRRDIRNAGPVVLLTASVDTIDKRINTDPSTGERRPNLTAAGGVDEIEELLTKRDPLYRECASITVDSTSDEIPIIVDRIAGQLPFDLNGDTPAPSNEMPEAPVPVISLILAVVFLALMMAASFGMIPGIPAASFAGWPQPAVFTCLFIVGASIGSFLNVCIYRIPNHDRLWDQLRGLTTPPSTCPRCKNRIRSVDNIPIFAWLRLRGRCRFCRLPISPRYMLIELLNGLLFVFVYWLEVPSGFQMGFEESCLFSEHGPQALIGDWSRFSFFNLRYAYHMVLIEAMVVATFIDFDKQIIPDASTLPAMLVGIIGSTAFGTLFILPVWFTSPQALRELSFLLPFANWKVFGWDALAWATTSPHLHGFVHSIAGLVAGAGVVWIVRFLGFRVLRQEAMGFGDVILMAMIGSFIGWQAVIAVFFIAAVIAVIVVASSWLFLRQREIPYGPYLSLGALVTVLSWNQIGTPIERIFSGGPFVFLVAVVMVVWFWASLHLLQLVKRLFGIPLYPPDEWVEEWSAADQHLYLAGEKADQQQGLWRRDQWPGTAAGRGQLFESRWRGR